MRCFAPFFALSALALIAAAGGRFELFRQAAAPTNERFVTRDITWSCGPDACQGTTQESRPLVLCQSLAKRAGRSTVSSSMAAHLRRRAREVQRCQPRRTRRRSQPNKLSPGGRPSLPLRGPLPFALAQQRAQSPILGTC